MEVEIHLEDVVAGTDAAREALRKCDVVMGYDRDGSGSRQMFYGLQTVQECHSRDDRLGLLSLRVVRVPVRFAEGCDEDLQLVAACVAIRGSHCYMGRVKWENLSDVRHQAQTPASLGVSSEASPTPAVGTGISNDPRPEVGKATREEIAIRIDDHQAAWDRTEAAEDGDGEIYDVRVNYQREKESALIRSLLDRGLGGVTVRRGRYRYTATEVGGKTELYISAASGAADIDFD